MGATLVIKDVTRDNLEEFIDLCIPPEKRCDKAFKEGKEKKKEWFDSVSKRHGSIAKIAYLDNEPVGMIQWIPSMKGRFIELTCIYVPKAEHQRQGVGTALMTTFLQESHRPRAEFGDEVARGIVTWAFEVPGLYPQREFFRQFGFKPVRSDNPHWLYLPLQDDETIIHELQQEDRYLPQEEDQDTALIFYDPSCPFCIYFSKIMERYIREISNSVPVRWINKMLDQDDIKKRGKVPFCAVNKRPIHSFIMDKESFQWEVRKALLEGSGD